MVAYGNPLLSIITKQNSSSQTPLIHITHAGHRHISDNISLNEDAEDISILQMA